MKVKRKVFLDGLFKVQSRDGHCQKWTGFQGVFTSLHFYFPHCRPVEPIEIQRKPGVLITQRWIDAGHLLKAWCFCIRYQFHTLFWVSSSDRSQEAESITFVAFFSCWLWELALIPGAYCVKTSLVAVLWSQDRRKWHLEWKISSDLLSSSTSVIQWIYWAAKGTSALQMYRLFRSINAASLSFLQPWPS